MDRLGHKMVALAVIFVTIFVMTALPIQVAGVFYRQGKRGVAMLSAIMCFGGGVFFGTYLLHMTPEVDELIERTIIEPNGIHYPVSYTIIGAGFFLMMFLEKAVIELQKWKERRSREKKIMQEQVKPADNDVVTVSLKTFNKGHHEVDNMGYVKSEEMLANGVANPAATGHHKHHDQQQHDHEHHQHEHHQVQQSSCEPDQEHGELRSLDHYERHDHGEEIGHSHAQGSAAKSIVLLLALSVDCVFEGLSLGLQKSAGGVWKLVLAILSHEVVVAFSLGLQLFKHNSPRRTLFMAFIYGITCPVGIAIGTAIMEGAGQAVDVDLVYGILLGLTAGVFIYVSFFEILMHEISHDAKMINLLAVLLGFGVMAGLMVLHNESHEHSPSNCTCAPRHDHEHHIAQWIDSYFVNV